MKRWLPVGPLPEGMAFSGSLQCMICNSCYQRINRYQSEERVSERISGRGAGRFRFQPRRRKLGSKTKFRVYAAPAHQPSSCRRMTIARFSKAPSIIVIIVIICYDDPRHDNSHHPTKHHGIATDAGMRWAYERTFSVIKTQLKRRKDWQQELTTAESLMRSGILDGYLSHHHDHQLMLLLDENLERKIDWGPPISEATLTEAANDTRCQYEK